MPFYRSRRGAVTILPTECYIVAPLQGMNFYGSFRGLMVMTVVLVFEQRDMLGVLRHFC